MAAPSGVLLPPLQGDLVYWSEWISRRWGMDHLGLLAAAVLLLAAAWSTAAALTRGLRWVWWTPRRLERVLRQQGIGGNPYRPLVGDTRDHARLNREARSRPMPAISHDIAPRVYPLLHQSMAKHGKICYTWFGPYPRVIVCNLDMIKDILSTKFGHFEKPKADPVAEHLVTGLVFYEGDKWAKHRRIINPAFHVEKLKCMLPAFSTCCAELIARWEKLVGPIGSYELDVWPELQKFSGDVISRTAFGSSFEEGRRIFQLQTEQAELLIQSLQNIIIPGYRYLPTKKNRRMKEIAKEVRGLLRNMIMKREKAMKLGIAPNDDLLSLLLESNLKYYKENGSVEKFKMTAEDVVEECKLFYFAGQETASSLLTWTMVVLSVHPSWQAHAREEVLQVFGKAKPDFDSLSQLKVVTMILYEVLRLYPPITFLIRSTYKTMELGGFTFPAGVQFLLPILSIHHDPTIWGTDANEFNPERFAEGVSKASKHQMAFMPFSGGPRICIGQNFAMSEAKLGLAMILQHFSFELSPSYRHAPHTIITLQPQHGKICYTWFGTYPRVIVNNLDMIKDILSNKFGHFEKPKIKPIAEHLVAGLAAYEGEKWAKHKKIINPAFHVEKLKRMLPAFSTCCDELIARWVKLVGPAGSYELDVWPELRNFSGDVISRAAFGSSFEEGRRIFQLQTEQAELLIQSLQNIIIPGYRFLPTKGNRRMKEISKVVRGLLRNMIMKREKAMKSGITPNEDLLSLLLESNLKYYKENGNVKKFKMTTEDVIEECKLFYFAGQDTMSSLLTWTMVVLSMHPSWQARAREEVLQVFGEAKPDFESLSQLKVVTMILYEVLRLYPPIVFLPRSTYKTNELGGFTFPAGVQFILPILSIHHDPTIWGDDAGEFNPERFAEGVSKASKHQMGFMPFGGGPRICIGQNFAMLEAKLGFAMILQHFSFELSPSYRHAPHMIITLQPQHGAQLILHKL